MEWALDRISPAAQQLPSGKDLLGAAGIDTVVRRSRRKSPPPRTHAIRLNEVIVHNNRTWFGEGDIRLDALVVHGNGSEGKAADFYQPNTFSFPRVKDGEALPIGAPGLLLYYGQPRYFLDLFLLVSRDRGNSDNLAKLLAQKLSANEMTPAVKPLLELATSALTSNAITLALQAAVSIGNLAYSVVQTVTSNTIGLYRTSFLQAADNFGAGRHPTNGYLTVKDLSFRYEILPQ
jgi:hypothetical protein